MNIDLTRKEMKLVQAIRRIAVAAFTMTFCLFPSFQLAVAGFCKGAFGKEIVHYEHHESLPEKYSQNPEGESWKQLTGTNLQLAFIDWQLVTNPDSTDKYMDKRIIGTVKNNSTKGFSELKIEFTVYDEEGAQIAIVFSNFADLKPGGIWKFEIPVTSDVGKAELKGLYVPSRELKELEEQRIEKRGKGV